MLVVSFGVMKSASSFQYQVLTELLQARHSSYDHYIAHRKHLAGFIKSDLYFDPSVGEIENLATTIPISDYFAFKTHNSYDDTALKSNRTAILTKDLQNGISRGHIKIIGSIRDPRDIILSALDHSNRTISDGSNDFFSTIKTLEQTLPHIRFGFKKAELWQQTNSVLWIPFDSLFTYEREVLFAIQDHVGLQSIDLTTRVKNVKANNSIHQFNKGKKIRWTTEFSEEELVYLNAELKTEIEFYKHIKNSAEKHFQNLRRFLSKNASIINASYT